MLVYPLRLTIMVIHAAILPKILCLPTPSTSTGTEETYSELFLPSLLGLSGLNCFIPCHPIPGTMNMGDVQPLTMASYIVLVGTWDQVLRIQHWFLTNPRIVASYYEEESNQPYNWQQWLLPIVVSSSHSNSCRSSQSLAVHNPSGWVAAVPAAVVWMVGGCLSSLSAR